MINGERFADIVQQHSHGMYRLALTMLHSDADAQDAVADAIEAAWRRRNALRSMEALPAYLYRCVLHQCHGTLRRRRRETTVEDMEILFPSKGDETPLWMYLSALPQKYRLPLQLRYGENLPLQEVARILRVPRGTVSSRISRGLDALRGLI